MKWYQDVKGNTSSLRIIAMTIVVLGCSVVVSGVVGFFLKQTESMQLITVGAALIASAEFAKVFQKSFEKE